MNNQQPTPLKEDKYIIVDPNTGQRLVQEPVTLQQLEQLRVKLSESKQPFEVRQLLME